METQTIELSTTDGPMALYEARPDGDARGAVIVIQEAFGVNEHIEDVTRRFAEAGYYAVAPAIFHRAGGGTAPYDDFSKVMPTAEEEEKAEEQELDPEVAEHEREMAERGAEQKGEGRIP